MVEVHINDKEDYMPCLDNWYKSQCNNGNHIFIYSGTNASDEVPEGTKCSCGMTVAHYENCPCCNTRIFKPKLIN